MNSSLVNMQITRAEKASAGLKLWFNPLLKHSIKNIAKLKMNKASLLPKKKNAVALI